MEESYSVYIVARVTKHRNLTKHRNRVNMKRFVIEEATDTVAALIGDQIKGCETLADIKQSLEFESSPFSNHFVYKGGNHVAVHISPGFPRIAIIKMK